MLQIVPPATEKTAPFNTQRIYLMAQSSTTAFWTCLYDYISYRRQHHEHPSAEAQQGNIRRNQYGPICCSYGHCYQENGATGLLTHKSRFKGKSEALRLWMKGTQE